MDNSFSEIKKSYRMYWAGGLLAFLVITAIVVFTFSNRTEVEKMNDVFLVELANGMVDKISAMMLDSSDLLKTTHAAILQQAPDEKAMYEMLTQINTVTGFDNLYLSLNGNTPIDGFLKQLQTHNTMSLQGVPDGSWVVSSPKTDSETGRKFFTLGTPLYYNNTKIGELFGLYYLDDYADLLSLKSFGGEAFFHLCTIDGIPLVLSGNNDNLFKDGDMYSFIGSLNIQNGHTVSSIRQDMENGNTTLLKYIINDEERTAVMVTVPGTEWCVISIILDEITVQMANQINQSSLIYAIVMILAFGFFVSLSLVHSLRKEKTLKQALLSSHKLAKKLKLSVETDALTKVYSRTTATERIMAIIEETQISKSIHSLMIADVDNFKLINDTYGHQVGDVYLQEFVLSVKNCLRSDDVFGRLGGDEFIILLTDIDSKQDAEKIAMRILEAVNTIIISDVSLEKVGTSLGLVMIPEFGVDYDSLNNMADKALYAAKHAGKSTYVFYDESL